MRGYSKDRKAAPEECPKRVLALSTSRKDIGDDTAGIAVGAAKQRK
jgi:hypothetical protein